MKLARMSDSAETLLRIGQVGSVQKGSWMGRPVLDITVHGAKITLFYENDDAMEKDRIRIFEMSCPNYVGT